jgi:nucleoside-diphosphate-sugar epimerase
VTHILITGGTGFIGSYIAQRLLEQGNIVVCFDNFIDPSRRSFIGEKAVFHKGDITCLEEIISIIKMHRVERIIALASILAQEAEKNLQLAVRVNACGVNNVFEAARICNIKRVVHSSSISVYGNVSWYENKSAREVAEDFHPPNNVYSATKQLNEFMASRYNEYNGMEVVCLRVSIVFGYGRGHGSTVWIDNMISNPLRGAKVYVPHQSSQKLSLIYVKDLAQIFTEVVTASKVRHSIYNTGGHTVTVKEFSEIIKRCIPNAEFVFEERAPTFYLVHSVDNSVLKEEFNAVYHSLEESVKDQIEMVRKAERTTS